MPLGAGSGYVTLAVVASLLDAAAQSLRHGRVLADHGISTGILRLPGTRVSRFTSDAASPRVAPSK